jgi:hypothetical protein
MMAVYASCIVVNSDELLEAAAQSLINRRCREAAIHEVRGGLQALYSSLELLARAAKTSAGDVPLADRAIGIAKRAMANFEPAVLHAVEALTTYREAEVRVNVGEVAQEVLRFLRTDIANKQLVAQTAIAADAVIHGRRDTVRLWILGILVTSIDAAIPGATLALEVARLDQGVEIRVRTRPGAAMRGDGVVLAAASGWSAARGGRLDLEALPARDGAGVAEQEIRVYHPYDPDLEPKP